MKKLLDHKLAVYLLIVSLLSLSSEKISAEDKSGEKLVNRKVLILDFVNAKKNTEYGYLEDSIPEAIIEPLNKTKSFEILLRSTWKNFVIQQKFAKEDAYKEEVAIEAGKLAEADVVVIGEFIAFTDSIQLFAKAIEMSSGRVMVAANSTAPLDNNLFKAISALANTMSTEMKNKLPPLPQTVIVNERIKYIQKGGPLTSKERKKQEETESSARKWRIQEQIEAQRWRDQQMVDAQKWRAQEARRGWKENAAMLAQNYWAEPPGFRLFGNILLGTLSGAAMGFGSGLGFLTSLSSTTLVYTTIPSSAGALLGAISGILVTVYDNNHINDSILGDKLLLNTWTWWILGSVVGVGTATGISYLVYNQVRTPPLLTGLAIGSLTGLGLGIFFTILPIIHVEPKSVTKNLIFDFNLEQTLIGYNFKF